MIERENPKDEKEKEIRYESKIDGILMKYAWVCNDVSKRIKIRAHQVTTHTDERKFYATMIITKWQTKNTIVSHLIWVYYNKII